MMENLVWDIRTYVYTFVTSKAGLTKGVVFQRGYHCVYICMYICTYVQYCYMLWCLPTYVQYVLYVCAACCGVVISVYSSGHFRNQRMIFMYVEFSAIQRYF